MSEATPWERAREVAAAFRPLSSVDVALDHAAGLVLAADVVAATDLPPFDASAMDGWAVSGPPPWRLLHEGPLSPGEAVPVATGTPLPAGARAVLRQERGTAEGRRLTAAAAPADGSDVRRAASECTAGDVVARAGQPVVPALLGLAAAAGADRLTVVRRPVVEVLVTGDELVLAGPAGAGRLRDALGPMLPPWLETTGAAVLPVRRVSDDPDALRDALASTTADLVVTTGATARGPRDHLHGVLAELGAGLLVDGVAVRPGHPMLLAALPDGRPVVGLPGNPLAAVSGLVTLALPALHALAGRPAAQRRQTTLREQVSAPPGDVRLLPVRDGWPVLHVGPAMLRGLARADGLAVVPAGGAAAGTTVEVIPAP